MRDTSDHRNEHRHARTCRRALRAAAGTAVLGLLGACASSSVPPDLGLPASTVTVSAIADDPTAYEGKLVSVSSEIDRVFGPRWFSLGGEEFGGDELLVVGPTTVPAIVETLSDSAAAMNDLVQVTGYVRIFNEEQIEDEIGTEIGERWWEAYERKPVLVMTDLDLTPRVDVVPVAAVPVPVPVPVPTPVIVDEAIIVDAPDRSALVGRSVALFGARVQTVTGDHAFWVGPSPDRQLFVVLDSQTVARRVDIEPGQTVALAGVIRAVPGDLASVRGAWNLTAANEVTLTRERVYLDASHVQVTAPATSATSSMESDRIPVRKDRP